MARSRLLLALVALALVAAACGSSDAGGTAATAGSESVAGGDAAMPASVVLPTSDGGQLDFGDLEGQPTLLWFWAPW